MNVGPFVGKQTAPVQLTTGPIEWGIPIRKQGRDKNICAGLDSAWRTGSIRPDRPNNFSPISGDYPRITWHSPKTASPSPTFRILIASSGAPDVTAATGFN